MGNLMNCRFYRLDLAHALLNGNAAILQMVIALRASGYILKAYRDGRFLLERIKEGSVVFHAACQLVYNDVGKLLAVGLGNIEYADHLEAGAHHLDKLGDRLAVSAQNRLLRLGIDFLHLDLCLVGRGSKDFDALFALHHMAVKVALPCRVPGNQRCLRLLHGDEQGVVERIVVKLGHRAKVFLEAFRFKEFLDALFQLVRYLADLLGIFVLRHFSTSLLIKLHLEADILAAGIIQPDHRVIELRLLRGIKPGHPTPSLVK